MIDTDKYDNEGIELSDGGTICFPKSDGRIERIDKDGNIIEVRYQSNGVLYAAHEGQEWYELFDSRKALLAEIKRLREGRLDLINEVIRIINNKTGERVDADLHDYIIDRLVIE